MKNAKAAVKRYASSLPKEARSPCGSMGTKEVTKAKTNQFLARAPIRLLAFCL